MTTDPPSPPPGLPPGYEGPERRRQPRQPAGPVRFMLIPEPEPPLRFSGVKDISAHGIRLMLDRPFGVGTVLDLKLFRPGGTLECYASAKVVNVVEALTGLFLTGCAFDRPLSEDQLRGLL